VTRCLSFHATYRCRDSGACCTAGWPIPVEADRVHGLMAAASRIGIRHTTEGVAAEALVVPTGAPPETPALLATTHTGACVFYDATTGHHCGVHRAAGHAALPLACRQFPRVVVVDPRGASLTLSHFCPTAAALLDSRDPVRIVDDAPAFPSDGEYVGLDARASLPPLLRPNLLMDWDAVSVWEGRSVALITTDAASTADTFARLGAIVDDVRNWRPGEGALTTRIEAAFATDRRRDSHTPPAAELIADVLDAVPSDLRMSDAAPSESRPAEHIARRFLAAHAFASWPLHMGSGLRTWLRSLEAADALLNSGYGVRGADRLLRHLADPAALARRWARAERES
jgi:Fe-S-cluster containining protein